MYWNTLNKDIPVHGRHKVMESPQKRKCNPTWNTNSRITLKWLTYNERTVWMNGFCFCNPQRCFVWVVMKEKRLGRRGPGGKRNVFTQTMDSRVHYYITNENVFVTGLLFDYIHYSLWNIFAVLHHVTLLHLWNVFIPVTDSYFILFDTICCSNKQPVLSLVGSCNPSSSNVGDYTIESSSSVTV